jgi:hypothetical protein
LVPDCSMTVKMMAIMIMYKCYVVGHYLSSCLYLKTPSCLFFKTQRFGDWILSPSSGKTYSVGLNRQS